MNTKSKEQLLLEKEKLLTSIVERDKKAWTEMYKIIQEIEENELWSPTFHSFSQWVKQFSIKHGIHESLLWVRKRAGNVYLQYKTRHPEAPPIEDLKKVSAESIVLVDKIEKDNTEVFDNLMSKVLSNKLSRGELRRTYQAVRTIRNTAIDSLNVDSQTAKTITYSEIITALDIVKTLGTTKWLNVQKAEHVVGHVGFERNKYISLAEFPIYFETDQKPLRMDILVAENVTSEVSHKIVLRGVDIKVKKEDLQHNYQYTKYVDYVDRLYVAVPEELKLIANDCVPVDIGIVTVLNGNATIYRESKRLSPKFRHNTLTTLSLKLIRDYTE